MIPKVARTYRPSPRSGSSPGFTLLEAVVVLLIVSFGLSLFWAGSFKQEESVRTRAFVSELSQFLAAARSQALLQGAPNPCVYDRKQAVISEELKGRSIQIPQGVQLRLQDQPQGIQDSQVAVFFPDGAFGLRIKGVQSSRHAFQVQTDLLQGRIEFRETG